MINKIFSWIIPGIIVIIFIFLPRIIELITDYWWYQETGYTQVFLKSLSTQAILGATTALISALFLISNILIATRTKYQWIRNLPESFLGQAVSVNDRIAKKIGITVSIFLSLLIGFVASSQWQNVLQFLSTTPFKITDPIFHLDISFYVFSLPVFTLALGILKTLTMITTIICASIYILRGDFHLLNFLKKSKNNKIINPATRIHLSILVAIFLSLTAANTWTSLYNILTTPGSTVFGATYTDTAITIPLLQASIALSLIAAFFTLLYGFTEMTKPFITTITLSFIVGIASSIIPGIFQKLIVAPNELNKETPFIKHNIQSTRQAYNLSQVEKREIDADKSISAEDIKANDLTIKNVRLWDRDPLLSTFSQIQEIRTYYEFNSVDNDRYTINNELRQIMLSPRELSSNSLPNKNWINEQLTFTHGYGVAAGPVNQVNPEGLPVLFTKDIPPKSEVKELEVKRPEIYYGEIPNEYIIVNTKSKEFDYPKGEENIYTSYQGTGGVEINSPLRRIMYALRFSSLKLLLSNDIENKSRILYSRNITERVKKIAPFLTLDNDPYLVIADGKLSWIIDAYTTTDKYPYSQPAFLHEQKINYIRNSVKITVDAYSGKTDFYQTDPDDPLIKTYAKIFPNMFKPLSDMPQSLLSHIRYPEDVFAIQTSIYTTYHMSDPQIFYNKEDQWEIPAINKISKTQETTEEAPAMTPSHIIMKLPGEQKEEFIFMLPFTPRAKDNLSAWMVARNDGKNYGKLIVYNFPKDKLVFGPKQIIGRISQDAEISRQIALWDQRGSQVIQGNLSVIPVEESLLYIRPLYLKAETGKIPELKRVIVAYGNKIAMEETLEQSLAKIFDTQTESTTPKQEEQQTSSPKPKEEITTPDQKIKQASVYYESAIQAQKEGDWTKYGEEIKKLGEILNSL